MNWGGSPNISLIYDSFKFASECKGGKIDKTIMCSFTSKFLVIFINFNEIFP